MDQSSLEHALAGLPLSAIRYFPQTGSTNDDAAHWIEAGAADLSLVVAGEQTAGRGRLNRRWFTPPGAALAFSLILSGTSAPVPLSLEHIPRLTALGALGICQALQTEYQIPCQIKWPNDVLIRRRKTAGILVEAYWSGEALRAAILGIGINVSPAAVPPSQELIYPATCVQAALPESAPAVDRLHLLRLVLAHLLSWRTHLDQADFLQAWEENLAFRGEWVHIVSAAGGSPDEQPLEALVLGLDPEGALRVQDRLGQVHHLTSGELRLRPVESP